MKDPWHGLCPEAVGAMGPANFSHFQGDPAMTQRTEISRSIQFPCLAGALLALALATASPVGSETASPRIQEVLYDGSGSDAEEAFTEITGQPGMALDGWSLVGVNGSNGIPYRTIALDGAAIPADGVLVVAHEDAAGAALTHRDLKANVDWQNGPDAVQLRNPQDQIVDALQYGDAGQHNAGEGSPAPQVNAGWSLSRAADGADSGDNLADFTPLEDPTPGSASTSPQGPGSTSTPGTGSPLPSGPRLILPDTTASYGARIDLPVRLAGAAGEGIVAVELFVAYGRDLLTAAPAAVARTDLTSGWILEVNTAVGTDFNTLKIGLASAGDPLAEDGTLVHLSFDAADLRRVTTAPLYLTHAQLNDGTPEVARTDGQLRWTGATGSLEAEPLLLFPGTALILKARDVDEDRDPGSSDRLTARLEGGGDSEQVNLVEIDAGTGLFQGTFRTLRGTPEPGNGRIELGQGSSLKACYDDSLDAAGGASEHCVSVSVGGEDGLLAATAAAEPGDTLRIVVTDPDLNLDPLLREEVDVEARRNAAGTPLLVRLQESGMDDSRFAGRLPLGPTESEGVLAVARSDRVEVRYEDALTLTGVPAGRTAETTIVGLFGDADGNRRLQTFDAAQVLSHVLEPFLTGLDSLAANVDARAFDSTGGSISSLDASLILQHRVGLIHRFPVQEDGADNHPQMAPRPATKEASPAPRLALRVHPGYLAVWMAERAAAPSGSLTLEGVRGRVELDRDLAEFLLDYRHRDGGTRVAFAGASPARGAGELLRLYPEAGTTSRAARLSRVQLADNHILTTSEGWPTAIDPEPDPPGRLILRPNHPNPFNLRTTIPFQLGAPGPVSLSIHNSLGQLIRIMDVGHSLPGAHEIAWDGTDQAGRPLASGRYHARLSTVQGHRSMGILLLK